MKDKSSAMFHGIVSLFLVTKCYCGLLGLGLVRWLLSKTRAPLSLYGVDWNPQLSREQSFSTSEC